MRGSPDGRLGGLYPTATPTGLGLEDILLSVASTYREVECEEFERRELG